MGEPLYLEQHRIRSGEQTITVPVPSLPGTVIVPADLLIDLGIGDNVKQVEMER